MTTETELAAPTIWDNALNKQELTNIKFDLYLNGDKGDRPLTGKDFLEWLALYKVDPSSLAACQAEMGVTLLVPEGKVRWVRLES